MKTHSRQTYTHTNKCLPFLYKKQTKKYHFAVIAKELISYILCKMTKTE